ncbi:hypothetical protein ABVN80_18210 [Acinetobacter baumannii]
MGEYFRDRGEDALIIYDDLSQASCCFTVKLHCFYVVHQVVKRIQVTCSIFTPRLLERASRVSAEYVEKFTNGAVTGKTGSLTALPIIETQAGDVSAFVPTNVISITDGRSS